MIMVSDLPHPKSRPGWTPHSLLLIACQVAAACLVAAARASAEPPQLAQLTPGDLAPPPIAIQDVASDPVRSDREAPESPLAGDAVDQLPGDVAAVLSKQLPQTADDLRILQQQVVRVLQKALPATVGIELGEWSGSGVVVSPEGLVLTAGHVVGMPNEPAQFIFPDGARARGRMLGINRQLDCGMVQIVEPAGPWPFLQPAQRDRLTVGEWVVATGQPGGFRADRTPPVRLGRVLYEDDEVINTDCTLVGGDSGGPLVDMRGQLVGIHSRIGQRLTSNFHVPIRAYREHWNRLLAGEVWGGTLDTDDPQYDRPLLGLAGRSIPRGGDGTCHVTQVFPNMPAELAGIRVGDLIRKFDGQPVDSFRHLTLLLLEKQPGDRVAVELRRGAGTLVVEVWLGRIGKALPGSAGE